MDHIVKQALQRVPFILGSPIAQQVYDLVEWGWKKEQEEKDGSFSFDPNYHFDNPGLRHYLATHYPVSSGKEDALVYFDVLITVCEGTHYICKHGLDEFTVQQKRRIVWCQEREVFYPEIKEVLSVAQATDAKIMDTWS